MEGTRIGRGLLAPVAVLVVAGCGKPASHALMPLDIGKVWTYEIRLGIPKRVEQIKVTRKTAVGGVIGVELEGPLGISRIAWRDDQLIADAGAHARFDPPIPLLDARQKVVPWHGRLTTVSTPRPASALITTIKEDLSWKGRKRAVTHSTVAVQLPDKKITLDTWFLAGVGIVKQEQRTGVRLDNTMVLLNEG